MVRTFLIVGSLAVCFAAAKDDIVLPDGKAKTLIENTCTECHGLDTVVGTPMPAEKWRETVKSMVKRGATLSATEIDTVVDYLTVYFSLDKVNVNTAGPQELQDGLKLTAAEATAILQHRKASGPFKDLGGLMKVAGLDAKKIEAAKDSISF
jgi:competence ComEA-like helix-hairpin-helix protein